MLTIMTGGQGSGKSYSMCLKIEEFVLDKKRPRHVITNLPLRVSAWPDRAKPFLHVLRYEQVSSFFLIRISPEGVLTQFSDYVIMAERFRADSARGLAWPGLAYCFDELYEHFPATGWRKSDSTQEDLLSYCGQHRHFGDDLYLISHDERDIHHVIRRKAAQIIRCVNAKYEPVYPSKWLLGLTWACLGLQAFREDYYEASNLKKAYHTDLHVPDKVVFSYYDSYSAVGGTITDRVHGGQTGSDQRPWTWHFWRWARLAIPVYLLGGCLAIAFGWYLLTGAKRQYAALFFAGPKAKSPQVELPQVEAPQLEAPEGAAPQIAAPQIAAPEGAAPEVEAPAVSDWVPPISVNSRVVYSSKTVLYTSTGDTITKHLRANHDY